MSDSEGDIAIPGGSKIEQTLRAIVARLYKAGDHEELTVKRVRKAAEIKLDLPDDFLKENGAWKVKSKDIIADEHEKQENEESASNPAKPSAKPKAAPKAKRAAEPAKRGTKRPAPDTKKKPQKKRKVSSESEDEDEEEESAVSSIPSDVSDEDLSEEEVAPKKAAKPRAKKVTKNAEAKRNPQPKPRKVIDSDEEDEASSKPAPTKRESRKVVESDDDESEASPPPESPPKKEQKADSDVEMEEPLVLEGAPQPPTAEADASESEMSVLIDEDPPPKKMRQKKDPASKPTKASKSSKPKAEPKAKVTKPDLSPQDAQIKELQGQLVKCGIRKMWHNELKNCDSAKEKISHLKGMLKEAGMDGRFSESKAKEIKERRELEKDMEEAKDYAAKFGAREDKGRRKLGAKDWGIDESLLGGDDDDDSD